MLEAIDCNKTYYDEYGAAVIVGVVKSYVVWRRPRAAVQVCTLNDFARRFSEKPHNAELWGDARLHRAASHTNAVLGAAVPPVPTFGNGKEE